MTLQENKEYLESTILNALNEFARKEYLRTKEKYSIRVRALKVPIEEDKLTLIELKGEATVSVSLVYL